MDAQEQAILRAIAISSSSTWSGQPITTNDRQAAFQVLADFAKYPGRIPLCLKWLQQQQQSGTTSTDDDLPSKLYACEVLADFLKHEYAQLSDVQRIELRKATLQAAQWEAFKLRTESTVLSNKVASLLAGLVVRDFPQRWTTMVEDIFGIWTLEGVPKMGNKICLEVLKLVAEDCTDSDFNAKISTKRRNDILLGLNEISSQFLPALFQSLEQISLLTQCRSTLHNMRTYLVQNQQTLSSMNPDQAAAYQAEDAKAKGLALAIVDTLVTCEKFCRSMPLDWMLLPQHDFSAAFIHLMREPTERIHLVAVDCLEQLCLRGKLTYDKWLQWIQEFPVAVQQVNQQLNLEQEVTKAEVAARGGGDTVPDPLTAQLDFHRSLSKMLAAVVSGHLGHLTQNKRILDENSSDSKSFSSFLRLLVDMLHHPSGRVAVEQLQLWISLFRDPQITNKKYRILRPFAGELISCFMDQMIRIRWEDVEDEKHPYTSLMEASWDDDDEYNAWFQDYRSKATQFFKYVAHCEPGTAAQVLSTRIQALITSHGNGEPRDHLNSTNQQLTMQSDAVRYMESVAQPMECILSGLPSWALTKPDGETPGTRSQVRTQTVTALSQMAQVIVGWNPSYLWLKMRRAQLLEGLRDFWQHDPTTLLQGIDSLLGYIRVPDEWGCNTLEPDGTQRVSSETVGLRKKSSSALVSVAKKNPQHLVPWLSQLSEAARQVLSSTDLLPSSRMHLYEFLSCVATAVDDPNQRSTFIENVLSDAINTLQSSEMQEAISSVEGFLAATGVTMAGQNPSSVTDPANVKVVSDRFSRLFSAFNQLLSVGRRCHEAVKKRPSGGIPLHLVPPGQLSITDENQNFPDEGPVSIRDLTVDDPFVPLWPRILPNLIKMTDIMMKLWHPEYQARLLQDRIQRYVLAISDDEAYLSRKNDGKTGGVFGEGGSAGSIISGTDRRDLNLAPRWSAWFNELRNTLYQMLGLLAAQRVLFAPEVATMIPQLVAVVVNPENLRSMEHRHFNQYLKQFIEILLLACPKTLYMTHLAPIIGPVFEHLQFRLDKTWQPVKQPIGNSSSTIRALFTSDCVGAATQARQGGDAWILAYYARSCLFVGDLDAVTAEAAVEKQRVEMTRTFGDVLQAALALKGEWALVLANIAREEMNGKKSNDYSTSSRNPNKNPNKGPPNRITEGKVNADGTPRSQNQEALDARRLARISAMCHFLFLEHEQIAGYMTLTVIQCLGYPDAYTCRRMTRICHRILESTAWHPRYTEILGQRMMAAAVQNIVMEPKWMVGIEWDMINVIRDIYGRLTLGQAIQPGGQGAGQQQVVVSQNPLTYEQAKTADRPLQGGGILTTPSDLPRQVLLSLAGVDTSMIRQLDEDMKRKRSAKDQKDFIRDVLRAAADAWSEAHPSLDRAAGAESLLHKGKADVQDIPEKLVTQSMMNKKNTKSEDGPPGLGAFELFS